MFAIRFLFRLAAMLVLAAGVVMAVVDATRSIAADEVRLTSLQEAWAATAPGLLETAQASVNNTALPVAGEALAAGLALPAIAVLALLALLLYAIGRKRPPAVGRFVVES